MPFSSTDLDSPSFDPADGSSRRLPIEGTDVMQARHVVIRTINWQSGRSEALERFHSEILALARLHHPHLERIHHLFRAPDHYLAVFEQRQGEPLDETLRRSGPIPWRTATSLICQALDGLQHAHLHGLVHRDVRPSNLDMTGNGDLKVCNFGVVRGPYADNAEFIGQFDGSLHYMAPEQVRGEPGDCRIDVYAIGAVLFEMLAGRPLFDQVSEYDLMLSVVRDEPVSLRSLNPTIPERLQAAVQRAVAKSSRQRFQTAFEFRSELEVVLADEAVRTRSEPIADVQRTIGAAPRPTISRTPAFDFGSAVRKASHSLKRRWLLSASSLASARARATFASMAVAVFGTYALWPTEPSKAPASQVATPTLSPATTVSQDPLPATPSAESARDGATDIYLVSPSQVVAPTGPAEVVAMTALTDSPVVREPLIPSRDTEIRPETPASKPEMVASIATVASDEPSKTVKGRARVSFKEPRNKLRDGGWKIISD